MTVATVSMQIATKEARGVSGHSDSPDSVDGTWQKRGHTSLNDAVIATSVNTGKVLDASILSRFCECPNKMHNENCTANLFGKSGSMEVSGVTSKSSNALKVCMVYDIPNFWEMVAPECIKQLTEHSRM
ncbi:uncharacterized protein TNCV_3411061 [Trichonephila clavipes]|nr:uncharacterized protein TNCV_3411061 [Trichonephila clavipes]